MFTPKDFLPVYQQMQEESNANTSFLDDGNSKLNPILAEKIMKELKGRGISVKYDEDAKKRPGFKFAEYEMKGVPVRMAVGPRDLENNTQSLGIICLPFSMPSFKYR